MEIHSNIVTLMSDHERYDSAFLEYSKRCKRDYVMQDWINMFYPEHITNALDVKTDELRTLSVGSGPGLVDKCSLQQLLKKWNKINHTVIEPNHTLISRFQETSAQEREGLSGVSFEWRHKTLEQFRKDCSEQQLKYHVIMAFHVLYYFDDLVDILTYLTSILEDGGILLVIIKGDDSTLTKIVEKFPQLQSSLYQSISTKHIQQTLSSIKATFKTYRINVDVDATGFDDDESTEGQLLIDFLTHASYLKQRASAVFYDNIVEYLKSEEVSLPKSDDGKLSFRCDCDAILVTV